MPQRSRWSPAAEQSPGIVKNSAGAAIAGASVGYGGGTATTDAYGNYTLTGVPVGTVQLVASASGFQSVNQNVAVTGGKTTAANFTLAAAVSNGMVTGKITNVSNGAILTGATVSWSGGSTTSNASGIYTLTNVTGWNAEHHRGKNRLLAPHSCRDGDRRRNQHSQYSARDRRKNNGKGRCAQRSHGQRRCHHDKRREHCKHCDCFYQHSGLVYH